MDPLEMLVMVLSIRPDALLLADVPQAVECYRASDASGDPREKSVDSMMCMVLHRELTIRGHHAEALDLFNQVNAIRPVLPPGSSYTEYVDGLLNH